MDLSENKLNTFKNVVLTTYPSIFYIWYMAMFTDFDKWIKAKRRSIITISFNSIVGYILGYYYSLCF